LGGAGYASGQLSIHIVLGIEILYLTRHIVGHPVGIEQSQPACAGLPRQQVRPKAASVIANRCNGPKPSDNNPFHTFSQLEKCLMNTSAATNRPLTRVMNRQPRIVL
jgi:hypothetical protein